MDSQEIDGFVFRKSSRNRRRRQTIAGGGIIGDYAAKTGTVVKEEGLTKGKVEAVTRKSVAGGDFGQGGRRTDIGKENVEVEVGGGEVVERKVKTMGVVEGGAGKKGMRKSVGRKSVGKVLGVRRRSRGKYGKRKLYLDVDAEIEQEERLRLFMEMVLQLTYAWAVKNVKEEMNMELVERATEGVLGYVVDLVEEAKNMGGMDGMKRVNPKTLMLRKKEAVYKQINEQFKLECDRWDKVVEEDGVGGIVEKVKSIENVEDAQCGNRGSAQAEIEAHRRIRLRNEHELTILRIEEMIAKMRALEQRQEDTDHYCEAISDALNERAFNGALSVQNTKSAVRQFLKG